MGMFAVKTEKKPEQPKPDEPVTAKNEKPAKPVEKSKPSGMMSFFGKQISGETVPKYVNIENILTDLQTFVLTFFC